MIQRLFETHLNVRDLERSIAFYRDVLGLELGRHEPTRRAAFFWVGGPNVAMLGLWEKAGEVASQHFAFEIAPADFPAALDLLRQHQVLFYNFLRDDSERPMVFAWMPAVSIYFPDPDGHELEFIAPLPGPPRPEMGIVSWEEWNHSARHG